MNLPAVSVIIPTFNRAGYICDAVSSILNQTYRDLELIVVDDGSTDNTEEVLRPFVDKITFISQPRKGPSAARNHGLREARGKYIAFLDSDDISLPRRIETQVEVLERYPEVALVYSNFIFVDDFGHLRTRGNGTGICVKGNIFEPLLLTKIVIYPSTWMVRKSAFDEVGYFDEELKRSEDHDMELRIARKYEFFGLKQPLVKIRMHTLSSSQGRCSAASREYYRYKLLEKLFIRGEKDPLVYRNRKKLISLYSLLAAMGYIKEGNAAAAKRRLVLSLKHHPLRPAAYLYLFSTLFGDRVLEKISRWRKAVLKIFAADEARYFIIPGTQSHSPSQPERLVPRSIR